MLLWFSPDSARLAAGIVDGKILVWKELNYGKMSEKEKQQLVSEVNILRRWAFRRERAISMYHCL